MQRDTIIVPKPQKLDNGQTKRTRSHWPDILALVENRDNFHAAEFVHLLLIEMSLVCSEIKMLRETSSGKCNALQAELRALRTLADTSRFASDVQAELDSVNLNGAKFRFVLHNMMGIVRDCVLTVTERDQFVTKNLLSHLRMQLNDKWKLQLERDTKKVTDFPEQSVWPREWWE
jgi:hypothetical protein